MYMRRTPLSFTSHRQEKLPPGGESGILGLGSQVRARPSWCTIPGESSTPQTVATVGETTVCAFFTQMMDYCHILSYHSI